MRAPPESLPRELAEPSMIRPSRAHPLRCTCDPALACEGGVVISFAIVTEVLPTALSWQMQERQKELKIQEETPRLVHGGWPRHCEGLIITTVPTFSSLWWLWVQVDVPQPAVWSHHILRSLPADQFRHGSVISARLTLRNTPCRQHR